MGNEAIDIVPKYITGEADAQRRVGRLWHTECRVNGRFSVNQMRAFIGVDELSARTGISGERIRELCASGHMPHILRDRREPVFRPTEACDWIADNLYEVRAGCHLPRMSFVVSQPGPLDAPLSIANVEGLSRFSATTYTGVYFLCDGPAVVYVGQAQNIVSRLFTHMSEGKKRFDRCYYIQVPRSELDVVETEYVRLLKPKYNGRPPLGWADKVSA